MPLPTKPNTIKTSSVDKERREYTRRLQAMRNERSSWEAHWREIGEYIQPRKGRFTASDRNKGNKAHWSVINSTPIWAARTLASGMMAGITSPARPWFRLTTPDPELAEHGSVKEWLFIVEDRIRQAFSKSNIYNSLHTVYGNLATFGTSVMLVEEGPKGLHSYVFPVGQFALANDDTLHVNTLAREFSMTVAQVVRRFGRDVCSDRVKRDYDEGRLDSWVEVAHLITPNEDKEHGRAGKAGMPFRSCWWEVGAREETGFLQEGGYEEFPAMCPRWDVAGEDIYGMGPGFEALGDSKALQLLEKRKAMAVDKLVNPPMRAPSSLRGQRASLLPGDITYVDSISPGQTYSPAMEIAPAAVSVVNESIAQHELRINRAFFADLWLAMTQREGTMTAREVAERHDEKMLQLGPVMERLQYELLNPLIDRSFGVLYRAGKIPDPPAELQGVELRVDYVSVMAQAQRLVSTGSVERLASFVGNLAAVKPEVLDKVDFDQAVDEYGQGVGVPPSLVRPDEQVAAIRAERAQAAMAQQQAQTAAQGIQGAKILSETDTSGDNALTRLLGGLGGVASAGVGARS